MQRAEGKILSNGFLTGDDVSALSPKELRLLRNTIYARYGRVFSEPELSRYFAGRPWYQPSTDYSDDKISDTDRANTEMIKVFENGGTTPIDATTVRKEVKEVLDGWADTTRDRDLDEHMSFYAPSLETFYNARNVSAAQVRKDRARAFERYSEMDVKLENVQVKPDPSGTRATVTFDKTWDFDGDEKHSTGSVRQQLSLTKAGDRWLITGEKDLEVLYTNSEER
jgi:ketosteroid isomerase-like protein